MKLVIITGTSNGLGKKLYDLLQKHNIDILSLSRTICETQINNIIKIDLSNINDIINLEFNITKKYDDIIFINNAFHPSIGKLGDIEDIEISNIVNINITSSILLTKKIIDYWYDSKINIINISSGVVNKIYTKWSLYTCSKTFMELFFNTLEKDYQNINIINYDPGVFDSNIQRTLRDSEISEYFINLKNKGFLKNSEDVAKDIFYKYIYLL